MKLPELPAHFEQRNSDSAVHNQIGAFGAAVHVHDLAYSLRRSCAARSSPASSAEAESAAVDNSSSNRHTVPLALCSYAPGSVADAVRASMDLDQAEVFCALKRTTVKDQQQGANLR